MPTLVNLADVEDVKPMLVLFIAPPVMFTEDSALVPSAMPFTAVAVALKFASNCDSGIEPAAVANE